jgi:hypothetical protein
VFRMNCERFQTVVNDLARDQMMEAGERASAHAHVAECDACASVWEDERSLTAGLRSLSDKMKLVAAPARLEAKVLTAFRERGNVSGISGGTPIVMHMQARRQPQRYLVAAIAALLLIVFGIFVVRGRVLSRLPQQSANDRGAVPAVQPGEKLTGNAQRSGIASVPDQQPEPVKAPRQNDAEFQRVSNPPRSNRGKRANVTTNAAATPAAKDEIATGFFPLGYGTAPNLQEGGQLMRVELSRDAVARFGLPVNMDRTNERVKADVLVGADGLAQAIRFVH